MKVSVNWLKDFVNIKVSPKVLAEKLTMAGLEVASQETINNDVVFEIEITANRPDCLSILGIAQEVVAVLGTKLKTKNPSKRKPKAKRSKAARLKKDFISIQNKDDCAFYRGCLITDIKIGPSPQWLRDRIEVLGVRSVNNIVDITNYCLLEYGQPLHAFDYNKIIEKIFVRRARKNEKILTIDEEERGLSENILVISDKNKAIAIAGIMGDKLSEVDSSTKNILLESAYFDPVIVRRGSRQLGLASESSYRFERQVDFERVKLAQDRAIELISELAGGKFVDEQETGKKIKQKSRQVSFNCARASKLLAFDIKKEQAKKIFSGLGFSCSGSAKDSLLVNIPVLRRDIKIEEDLVEEFARIYGYSNVPSTLPAIRSESITSYETENIKQPIKEALCALGFNEVINYSLMSKDMLDAAGTGEDAIRLKNPLSYEQEYLRSNLTAGLLNCLAYNLNRKNLNLRLFELGHIFGGDYNEEMVLGLVSIGKDAEDWQTKKELDLFALKGSVQNLIGHLGFEGVKFLPSQDSGTFIKGETARISCQGRDLGVLGRVDKPILSNFGIKNIAPVYYAEISIERLCNCNRRDKRFKPLNIFPSAARDLSLIVKKSIHYQEVIDIIKEEAGDFLRSIRLSDVYKGEQIAPGSVGLTISLELGLAERTLTDVEATDIQQKTIKRLKSDLGVGIR